MKGVVLAAGRGSRMKPFTALIPKHLLPVYDKPLIFYPILTLKKSGISDIILVCSRQFLSSFVNLLADGKEIGVNLSYVIQEEPLGMAHALSTVKRLAKGQNIACINGDNVFDEDFFEPVKKFEASTKKGGLLAIYKTQDKNLLKNSGVVKFGSKVIKHIQEKPLKPQTNWLATGFYLYDQKVFDIIEELKPSKRGEYEITDLNNFYVSQGLMSYVKCKRKWFDAGTFEGLLKASLFVAKKRNNELSTS